MTASGKAMFRSRNDTAAGELALGPEEVGVHDPDIGCASVRL
jgi:hypothetical protein